MDLPDSHLVLNSLVTAIGGGMLFTLIARKTRIPAIVLLLFGGIVLGPEGIGFVQPKAMATFLPAIVALAVGLILFEGGLTLDLRGYVRGSSAISRLLTIGVVVTWFGAAASVMLVFGLPIRLALLAGSLVIVTGPTVIGPLLKRIKVGQKLHSILHWEGVLIDTIGVFISILCFEWIAGAGHEAAVGKFGMRLLIGAVLGTVGGFTVVAAFRHRFIPQSMLNVFALGSAVLIFGAAEAVVSHAGLLAVTLAGFIVGWRQPGELRQVRNFKAEITDLLIGMLFILLAARLELVQFYEFGWRGALLVLLIMVVVRPLNVFLSTWGADLSLREKAFLSWVAPRGIVAASMASLFSLALEQNAMRGHPRFLESFTYSVITATVVLQGFTAGWLARFLKLQRPDPTGWLIVSADAFSRRIARFIRDEAKLDVLLLDTNARLIAEARSEGLPALREDGLNVDLAEERMEFQKVGHLLALTDNGDLNELLCERWSDLLGRDRVYRWRAVGTSGDLGRHGRLAFGGMPRPSVVAAELIDDEARLELMEAGRPIDSSMSGQALLNLRPGAVLFPDPEHGAQPLPEGRTLVLHRSGGVLRRSLAAGGVIDVAPGGLTELYRELIDFVVSRHPGFSREQTLREIIETGKVVPAWLGHGIAVPHLYSRDTSRRICVLARIRGGLQVPDEEEPMRIVFFLVSPAGDPEGHLAALAEIARLCADAKVREAILGFSQPAEALAYVNSLTV